MKRSTQLKLGLVSTIPVTLAACSPMDDPARNLQSGTMSKSYETVSQCTADSIPTDICSQAFMAAMNEHGRIAPTYKEEAECEADFVPDYCEVTSNGNYMPKLGGFQLNTQFSGTPEQIAELKKAYQDGQLSAQGGGGGNDMLVGLLLGQMLSGGRGSYSSQPLYADRRKEESSGSFGGSGIYSSRNGRGSYSTSTLASQIERGKTFQRSTQVSSGSSYSTQKPNSITSGLSRSQTLSSKPVTVGSTTSSRNGFGAPSTARSGWGSFSGRSGGFGSSGG